MRGHGDSTKIGVSHGIDSHSIVLVKPPQVLLAPDGGCLLSAR